MRGLAMGYRFREVEMAVDDVEGGGNVMELSWAEMAIMEVVWAGCCDEDDGRWNGGVKLTVDCAWRFGGGVERESGNGGVSVPITVVCCCGVAERMRLWWK
uniref:Putative Proline rich extensin signature n=1 Tax=Davidia involucrata TaxID=16924 RepID=A0A5B7BE29_DAVIN